VTSRAAVARLKAMGMRVVMLTGDNAATAAAIAAKPGSTTSAPASCPATRRRRSSR
jgi:P-type E1-E2 ATPase